MAVVGIGVDVVDVDRFAAALVRTPGFAARVLTAGEHSDRVRSMAARFAAKEALAKALGAPRGLRWHDAVVRNEPSGRPVLDVTGTVHDACERQGVGAVHLTMSHDGGLAVAMVVLES
ncbi:MAG: holo-ACP synthase [Jiangellales bacterium]